MRREKSAGAVIFNPRTRKFLLLHYPTHGKGHWDFPKGHVEPGEGEIDTARREIKEETGLDVEFIFGFRDEITYYFRDGKTLVEKKVVYFLALAENENVSLSYEHDNYRWLSYEDSLKTITYETSRKTLIKAWRFLEVMGYGDKKIQN